MATRTRDDEFTDFVREHRDVLMRSACLIAGSRTGGDDLFQEALLRVYARWASFDPTTGVAYLRRIMVNLATDQFRRARFEPRPYDLDTDRGVVAAGAAPGSAEDAYATHDDIVRRLAVLTARERAIVVSRFYFDHAEKDVAAELGVSLGTVKSTCSRALAKMRAVGGPSIGGGSR